MKLAAFLILPLTLCASWNSCSGPTWGQVEFGVEALYWKPDNGGFDYANQVDVSEISSLISAHTHTIRPDYDWGVRGSGRYFSPSGCSSLELSGLWIRSTDGVSKPLTDVLNAFGSVVGTAAAAALRIEYWNLDLRLTQYLVRDSRYNIYALGGARFASHCFREASLAGAVESKFDGAGPEVGIGGDVCIWQGFSLISHSSIYAIVGERRTRGAAFPDRKLQFDSATVISPCLNIRMAIRYCLKWSSIQASGEIGYELDHYWNALNVVPPFNGANYQQRRERDIGWAGPYASLMVGF